MRRWLLLGILLCVPQAHAGFVKATFCTGVAVGTTGVSCTITMTNGDTLEAFVSQDSSATLTPTFSDSASDTYSTLVTRTTGSGNMGAAIGCVASVSGVTSVKIAWNTSSSITQTIQVVESSGTTCNTDGSGSTGNSTSGQTSLAGPSITTTVSGDFILYGVGLGSTTTGWADNSGGVFTMCASGCNDGSTAARQGVETDNPAGTFSGTAGNIKWTTSTITDKAGLAVAIKPSGGGSTSAPPTQMSMGVGD